KRGLGNRRFSHVFWNRTHPVWLYFVARERLTSYFLLLLALYLLLGWTFLSYRCLHMECYLTPSGTIVCAGMYRLVPVVDTQVGLDLDGPGVPVQDCMQGCLFC